MPRRLERFCTKAFGRFLLNLGLTEHLIPVGVPLPWPTATPPVGWLKCNGAAFDKNAYPQLALAYPSGKLPDLRGEFIRGFDDGRGVDSGRELSSWQKGSLVLGDIGNGLSVVSVDDVIGDKSKLGWDNISPTSLDYLNAKVGIIGGQGVQKSGWDVVYNYSGATRPRNVAFNYIVRAA